MSGRRGTLHLQTVDELLGAPVAPAAENSQVEIPVDKIVPFEHHPFKVLDDEKMADLVKSIRGNGVLTPVIVRPDDADGYEMISGHRRLHASKLAGLTMIPAIVKPMTDDEATIAMVDSNMQREEILPSERAFALKMKMDAMRRRGYRSDLAGEADAAKVAGMSDIATVKNQGDFETCGREVHKSDEGDQEVTCGHKVHKSEENQPEEILSEQDNHKPEDSERKFVNDMYEVSDQTSTCGLEVHKFSESRTRDAIGKEMGMGGRQVQRYLRLTELIQELLDMVDAKKISLDVGVGLSYLPTDVQGMVYSYMKVYGAIRTEQVEALKDAPDLEEITQEQVTEVLQDALPKRKDRSKVAFSARALDRYFPKSYTEAMREKVILQLLEKWTDSLQTNGLGENHERNG